MFSKPFQIIIVNVLKPAAHLHHSMTKCILPLSKVRHGIGINAIEVPGGSVSLFTTSSVLLKGTDGRDEERLKLKKWIEMYRYNGDDVPENINDEQFEALLDQPSEASKEKYLSFLFKREKAILSSKERYKIRREEARRESEERQKDQPVHMKYGLWHNTMFAKVTKQAIINMGNYRLAYSHIYNQPILMDLGFEDIMDSRNRSSLARQLSLSIIVNRMDADPFNLQFCNVNTSDETWKTLEKLVPINNPSFPISYSSKHYLDLYPKSKIIYLTPNAKEEMSHLDPHAVYIIGGIVDHGKTKPFTLAKAKRERIKHLKLPVDRYLKFKGQKSFGVHVVLAILLDLQKYGNWKKAFENIPRRLIDSPDGNDSSKWDKKILFRK